MWDDTWTMSRGLAAYKGMTIGQLIHTLVEDEVKRERLTHLLLDPVEPILMRRRGQGT